MRKVLLLILLFFFAFDSISQVKVTNLPPASSVDPLDVVPMVDVSDGVTKKLPISVLDSRYTGNDAVNSVNGKTGVVVINKGDVGLGNADNTSDANKPISNAAQAALDLKQDKVTGVDDTEIGYLNGVTSGIQGQIDGKVGKTGDDTITGTKSFTGRLETSSTTNSSRPCPPMTDAQMLALPSPGQGDCVYNATLDTMMVYKTSVPGWEEMGGAGGISNWITAHAYEVDDVVIESAKIYQCLIAHTSGTFATDLANGNWTIISGVNLSEATGILELDNGGTNKNLTPVNGGVAYTDADSLEVTAAGTSGQVLQSNGAAAPTWVNKSISGKAGSASSVTIEELQTNANQLTETATNKYHLEAPGNLLVNGSFNASVTTNTTPGWTVTATGGAVCTISVSTSSPLDGEKQYLVLSGSTAVSGTPGTCSIKQEVTTTQQVNALVGLSFLANPTGAGCSANDLVVRTLVNGAVVTSRDVTNCGVTSAWDFFYVNEVTGGTSTGVEAIITLAASTANSIGIDIAKVIPRELSGIFTGNTQFNRLTFTGNGSTTATLTVAETAGTSGIFTVSGSTVTINKRANINVSGFTAQSATDVFILLFHNGVILSEDRDRQGAANSTYSNAAYERLMLPGDTITFQATSGSTATAVINAKEVSDAQYFMSQCGASCKEELTASITGTTVTSTNGVSWVTSVSGTSTKVLAVPTGVYTVLPSCTCTVGSGVSTGDKTCKFNSTGASTVTSLSFDTTSNGASSTENIHVSCTKQGVDAIMANMIFGTFYQMMKSGGFAKPKTFYMAFGGAGSLTSPTTCSASPCTKYYDPDGVYSTVTRGGTGDYNFSIVAGTCQPNTLVMCSAAAPGGGDPFSTSAFVSNNDGSVTGGARYGSAAGTLTDWRLAVKCECDTP